MSCSKKTKRPHEAEQHAQPAGKQVLAASQTTEKVRTTWKDLQLPAEQEARLETAGERHMLLQVFHTRDFMQKPVPLWMTLLLLPPVSSMSMRMSTTCTNDCSDKRGERHHHITIAQETEGQTNCAVIVSHTQKELHRNKKNRRPNPK